MRAVIYARFSSSSQREESVERQVGICNEYAQRCGYKVIKTYADKAFSGKTDNRPNFIKMIKDSSRNLFDTVLVSSLDRFGRNLQQTLENENKLVSNGVSLISVREPSQDGPAGRLNRNIMLSYAQYYSDELSQKIKEGIDLNARKCLYHGGTIALGYKVGADKRFERNPDTAPVVKRIYEMYADGKTVTEIIGYLNGQGIKTARGNAFNKNSLHTLLKNRQYLGYYVYKGVETEGGMPRLISDELFNSVAKVLEENRKAPARKKAKIPYLLTTKLFCGHCKEMMTGFSGTGKLGKVYHYYDCKGRKISKCNKKMVDKDYIENLVVSECRRLLTAANIKRIAKEVVAICEEEKDDSNLKYLKKRLLDNERRQQNTISAVMENEDEFIRRTFTEQLTTLRKEHEEIEIQIAIEEAPFPTLTEEEIKFFLTQLKRGNVDDMKYRKTLINVFVNKIYLYEDRITITYNSGDEPVTISGKLLVEMEERAEEECILFFNGSSPP